MDPNTQQTSTSIKPKLHTLVARARAEQQAFVADTTPAEQAASGEPDHWSLKDHFAHMNFWRQKSLNDLDAAAKGETPENADDFQPVNERVFEERRQAQWADLMAESDRLFDALDTQIERFSDEEWTDPNHYAWRNGQPLVALIVGSFYEHPADHFAQLYRERGDMVKAQRIRAANAEAIGEILGKSEAYANAIYNLGCFYALNGEPEKAIESLRTSLPLNPALIEWSKQDSDLDSLRDLPAFQALY